jgi:hypothetical protein
MKEEGFLHILEEYRINQNMKNVGNGEYYAIILQAIPNLYGGNTLAPQSKIPDNV